MIDPTKVIGYMYDGAIYCCKCFGNGQKQQYKKIRREGFTEEETKKELEFDLEAHGSVIFAGDEFDQDFPCSGCGCEVVEKNDE